ncbi:MAG: N-acyl homoserine lactonase family protein [Alphaproteobacteria bacterium]|nr:N-acyl homoserine lactonase family protein [Alphaproteobacteria bacterium]
MDPYRIYAIEYARRPGTAGELYMAGALAHSRLAGGFDADEAIDISYFMWAIQNDERTVVVDMGFSEEKALANGRERRRCPGDGLREIGIEPATVSDLIVTHLHWDHAGNWALFPAAVFHLQRREMAFWTGPQARHAVFNEPVEADDIAAFVRLNLAGRVSFVDGDETLFPGIGVHFVGGHTAGLQVVSVETERGTAVIASDAIKTWRHLDECSLDPLHHDIPGLLDGYARCRRLAASEALILPGHDIQVLSRLETVADGIAVL